MEPSDTEVWSLLCNGSKLSRDQGEERLKELLVPQNDGGRGELEERLAQQLRHLAKNGVAEDREVTWEDELLFGRLELVRGLLRGYNLTGTNHLQMGGAAGLPPRRKDLCRRCRGARHRRGTPRGPLGGLRLPPRRRRGQGRMAC